MKLGDELFAPVRWSRADLERLAKRTNPSPVELAEQHLEDLRAEAVALEAAHEQLSRELAELEGNVRREAEDRDAEILARLGEFTGDGQ